MTRNILLLVLAIAGVSKGLEVDDCGSTSRIYSVTVPGCTAQPCTFRTGGTYAIEAVLGSSAYSDAIPFTISASILGIDVTLLSGNACDSLLVGNCPIYNGKVFTVGIYLTIPNNLPPISTRIRGIMRDDNDGMQLCAEIAVQLTN